jgi:hypothetical protein
MVTKESLARLLRVLTGTADEVADELAMRFK